MSATEEPEGKYQIWGFEASSNYDDANRGVDSEDQTVEPEIRCMYATDDIDEARTIMRNGGFFRQDGTTWVIAREGKTVDG